MLGDQPSAGELRTLELLKRYDAQKRPANYRQMEHTLNIKAVTLRNYVWALRQRGLIHRIGRTRFGIGPEPPLSWKPEAKAPSYTSTFITPVPVARLMAGRA